MSRRAIAWTETAILFVALYVGIPWLGLQVDRLLGLPPLPLPIRGLGVVLALVGLAGLAWCLVLFARVGRGTPNPVLPPDTLVTIGPYARTRNPIVLSHAGVLLGLSLAVGSIGGAAIVVLLAVPVYFLMTHEERTLEARFGEAYRQYKATVPRWIPRRTRRQS